MTNPVESSTPENFDALTKDPYKEKLYGLANEIKELTDDNAQNDIIGESVMVNDQLNNSLQEYLKNNKNVTDLIKGELNRIINDSNISQEAKDSANTLLRLIESINPAGETPITLETAEQSEEPKLDLK
jgi:argonaute-like protein implicated in RNA metabolism and viral defense